MAVYYKWIKGCSEGSTLNNGLWSYIKWAGDSESVPSGTINDLPYLYVAKGKKDDLDTSTNEVKDLGYLLTNNAEDVVINNGWTFNNRININNGSQFSIIPTKESTQIHAKPGIVFGLKDDDSKYWISMYSDEQGGFHTTVNKLEAKSGAKAEDLSIGNFPASEKGLGVEGKIESNNSVHAPYFNATSDMRAKENIKKLSFSALAFINNLSIYQFNYKDKNDTVPGVLAQDVLNSQPEGLSLVDNIDASGENGDYMSIKEDKFIFILMRAIQELKEDNDSLRYELEQLKQKLK